MNKCSMLRHSFAVLLIGSILNTIPLCAANKGNLDGEVVFRGILLGESPVADVFPEYYPKEAQEGATSAPDPAAKAKQETKEELLTKLRTKYPTFFHHFGEDMQSGERIKVSRALQEAEQNFQSVADGFDDPHRLHALLHGGGHGPHAHPSVLVAWMMMSDLEKDQLVDRVAQRLGPASRIRL